MNNADVAWMLVSTALVLLMTPALAFFYGGLVRSKNALNTMMMSFISLGFAGVAWALLGYSLAFAPGTSLVGGLSFGLLRGVDREQRYNKGICLIPLDFVTDKDRQSCGNCCNPSDNST